MSEFGPASQLHVGERLAAAAVVQAHREAQQQREAQRELAALASGDALEERARELAPVRADHRRQQRLDLAREPGHVAVLEDVGAVLVVAGVGDREADLVHARRPLEHQQAELGVELPGVARLREEAPARSAPPAAPARRRPCSAPPPSRRCGRAGPRGWAGRAARRRCPRAARRWTAPAARARAARRRRPGSRRRPGTPAPGLPRARAARARPASRTPRSRPPACAARRDRSRRASIRSTRSTSLTARIVPEEPLDRLQPSSRKDSRSDASSSAAASWARSKFSRLSLPSAKNCAV